MEVVWRSRVTGTPVSHVRMFYFWSFNYKLIEVPREDLKRHRTFDCEKCFREFDTAELLSQHQKVDLCQSETTPPAPKRDGIDPQQWAQVQTIMRIRSKTDVEKWMGIWKIIFPHLPSPGNPCIPRYTICQVLPTNVNIGSCEETELQLPESSAAIESLVDRVRINIRRALLDEKATFRYDEQMYKCYELAFREALEVELKKPHSENNQIRGKLPLTPNDPDFTTSPDRHWLDDAASPSRVAAISSKLTQRAFYEIHLLV